MPSPPKSSPEKEVVQTFDAAGVVEYLEYLKSGKRVLWNNFKAGIAKGLGITLGMTVVVGLAGWGLTMLVDIPLIGEYADKAVQMVQEYKENTNYTEEFAEMTTLLEEIRDNAAQGEAAVAEDPNAP